MVNGNLGGTCANDRPTPEPEIPSAKGMRPACTTPAASLHIPYSAKQQISDLGRDSRPIPRDALPGSMTNCWAHPTRATARPSWTRRPEHPLRVVMSRPVTRLSSPNLRQRHATNTSISGHTRWHTGS